MTANIVGREFEIAQLNKYYDSGKAEFLALYGRRRVGKTFLMRQYFKNDFAFDMTGVLEGTRSEQVADFQAALKSYGFLKTTANWEICLTI